MEAVSRHLVAHGSIVLLVAFLLGAPYANAITRNAEAQVIQSWRMAHQSLIIGALILFATASTMDGLAVPMEMKWAIALSLIVSIYSFMVASPLAAVTKDRGLQPGARGLARLVYVGNMFGAATSLLFGVLLVFAAISSL